MKKEHWQFLSLGLGGLIIAVVLFLNFGVRKNDVDFCRGIFEGLAEGRQSVQKLIDWKNMKALNVNIGETYNKYSDKKEKADYRENFIKSFSNGFKKAGGKFEAFSGWRLHQKDEFSAVVAADYKKKTLLLTISGYARRKLTDIQWESAGE